VSKDKDDFINDIRKRYYDIMIKEYPEEFKESKYPKKFD
jgi:hypothetical protein